MATFVELDRVPKAYEQKGAVRDLSLRIEAGTMFGLLGPNGAGKTSSIRMMVGITMPDSSAVSLFGRPFARSLWSDGECVGEKSRLTTKFKIQER